MKTKKMMRPIAMAACMLALGEAQAQTSVLGNTPTSPGTDYVGWDNSTTVPLMIKHEANQPIEWYTELVRRITLLPDATYAIGSFGGQLKNGHMLLSPKVDQFYTEGGPGPFSLLHLAASDNNAQQSSYREWMNTGVTFTGNADHQYIGQKGKEFDYTDMIIHWCDKQRLIRPRPHAP